MRRRRGGLLFSLSVNLLLIVSAVNRIGAISCAAAAAALFIFQFYEPALERNFFPRSLGCIDCKLSSDHETLWSAYWGKIKKGRLEKLEIWEN